MIDWPRPPRRVPIAVATATWAGLRSWLQLLLAACALGGLGVWIADDCRSPRVDWRLDSGDGREVARARITDAVSAGGSGGRLPRRDRMYAYAFTTLRGEPATGSSCGRAALAGEHHAVEYLVDDPACNRLVGMHHSWLAAVLAQWLGPLLLPQVLLALWWFGRAYRTYVVARHGRATAAQLVACQRRGRRLRARYRFVDALGAPHESWQEVLPASALGTALLAATVGAPIAGAFAVHGDHNAGHCRLVATAEVGEADA